MDFSIVGGDAGAVEFSLFEEVANALGGLVPQQLGNLRCQARSNGIKVWFGPERPPREHYEAQVIGPEHDAGAADLALEVGFHTEYPQLAENEAVIAQLLGCQDRWRPGLGDEVVIGPFLGHPQAWRRVSETWPDVDLGSTDLAFELAARLADYVTALEPVRRQVAHADGAGAPASVTGTAGRSPNKLISGR